MSNSNLSNGNFNKLNAVSASIGNLEVNNLSTKYEPYNVSSDGPLQIGDKIISDKVINIQIRNFMSNTNPDITNIINDDRQSEIKIKDILYDDENYVIYNIQLETVRFTSSYNRLMDYNKNTKSFNLIWNNKQGQTESFIGKLNSDGNAINLYRFKSQNDYNIYTLKIVKI